MLDIFEYGEESVCVPFTSFEGKLLTRKHAIRRGWQTIDDASSESKRCFMTARSVLAQDPEHMPMSTVDHEANGGRVQLSQRCSENELTQRLLMSHETQKEGANKVRTTSFPVVALTVSSLM
jgi:hypothetical protein